MSCQTKDTVSSASKQTSKKLSAEALARFQEKFFQGLSEKAIGNTEKSFQAFSDCLTIDPANSAVHYEVARIERTAHQNAAAALLHIRQSVAADPSNAWYQLELANTYTALGKYDLAAKTYKEAVRLNPNDPSVLSEEADAWLKLGKVQDAINTYDQLEKKIGPSEELSFQKHKLYLQLKNYEKAGDELEKLARAFPNTSHYWGMAAQFYRQTKQPEKALAVLEKMKLVDPDNGEIHYQLSEYYASSGDEKRSYEELKKAFETTDISIDQKINILLKYYTLTEINTAALPQAYELLNIITQVNPDEAKTFSMYGDFLYRDGENEAALEKYQKALTLDATRNQLWAQTLTILSSLKKYPEMEKMSTQAIEIFPNLPEFYYFNGLANDQLREFQKAEQMLSAGKDLVVQDDYLLERFYAALGTVYHSLGNHQKSDDAFDHALAIDPLDVMVLNNYAYYLALRKQRLDKAKEMAQTSNDLDPNNPMLQDTYAWVLYQQGSYDEALTWIEKAAASNDKDGEILEHLGDIQYKLGKKTAAVENWKKAAAAGNESAILRQKINEQRIID